MREHQAENQPLHAADIPPLQITKVLPEVLR
jgi:hypothetical protein